MAYQKDLVLGASGLAVLLGSFVSIAVLGDPHPQVGVFVIFYSLSFLFWSVCVYATSDTDDATLAKLTPWFCAVAAVISLLLLITPTSISTDIYRYIWDGGLTLHGINPYLVTPEHVHIPQLRESTLYSLLDWKDQFTVYPPLAQLLFVSAFLLYSTVGIIGAKILFAGGAVLSSFLFYHMLPRRIFLLAIVNPLFLFESFNGGHLDNYLVALVLGIWYFFTKKKYMVVSVLLSAAILIKIYPVIFLPLFAGEMYRRYGMRSAIRFSSICLGIVAVFYLPLLPHISFLILRYADWVHVMIFNASIYSVFLSILAHFVSNPAVWATRVSAVALVCAIALQARRTLTPATLFLTALAFILFSSVVYPWYTLVTLPFVFLIAAKDEKRVTQHLSALAVMQLLVSLTYISQSRFFVIPIRDQILHYVILMEYGALALILLTVWNMQKLRNYFAVTLFNDNFI